MSFREHVVRGDFDVGEKDVAQLVHDLVFEVALFSGLEFLGPEFG